MGNTLLTIDMITKEALSVLHSNLGFTKNINRQHDNSFAVEGAKIGTTLRIRKPARYIVSDGATLVESDTVEEYCSLPVTSQKHIGMNFTSSELTLSLDEFSDRIIKPAMSALASQVDSDAQSMYKKVYNIVGTPGTTPSTITTWLSAGQKINEFLAPLDERSLVMNPAAQAASVAALSGLFNPQGKVGEQYAKGQMGSDTLGFDWFMSQTVNSHTTGARATATTLSVGANVTTDTANVTIAANAGTWALKIGDVLTFSGVNAVNPETKQDTGQLQCFVVTADTTVNTTGVTVTVDPPFYLAASKYGLATVNARPQTTATVSFLTGSASTAYAQNLAFHKDAFTLATADLVLPKGVEMASRQVFDGVSLRIVRQYDVVSDKIRTRCDVLYGYVAQRPEWACRVTG